MQNEITPEYLASQGLSPTFPERFWSKVFILTYDRGCWLWTACSKNDKGCGGYGIIGRGWGEKSHVPIAAHIASWILHYGPVPDGLCVLHKCDVPPCVRPDHLWLGTRGDNNHDSWLKGRHRGGGGKGEDGANSKLTEKQVLEIRSRYAAGGVKEIELGNEFGVTQVMVSRIILRRAWTHI